MTVETYLIVCRWWLRGERRWSCIIMRGSQLVTTQSSIEYPSWDSHSVYNMLHCLTGLSYPSLLSLIPLIISIPSPEMLTLSLHWADWLPAWAGQTSVWAPPRPGEWRVRGAMWRESGQSHGQTTTGGGTPTNQAGGNMLRNRSRSRYSALAFTLPSWNSFTPSRCQHGQIHPLDRGEELLST